MAIFNSFLYVYQRVCHSESIGSLCQRAPSPQVTEQKDQAPLSAVSIKSPHLWNNPSYISVK